MLPTPATHQLSEVYDRSGEESHKNVDGLLFKAGRRSQSAELNEAQQYIHKRIDGLGSAIFADGDVTEGGSPILLTDVPGKNIRVHAGKIFLKGRIYDFVQEEFNVPLNEKVSLGVRLYTEIIDHTDDIGLLNPAVRRRGYGEPGAYRVKSWITWGFKGESGANDGGEGEFFPVYSIDNGVIIEENASPMVELVYKALRRYDMDGNGSYVSEGLRVSFTSETNNDYSFQLGAGSAHILGDIVERKADSRLTYPKDPDVQTSLNEFHLFTPDVNGNMVVNVSRPPIAVVGTIIGQKQKTITVIRGQTSNGKDVIDETISSIVSIQSVVKGGITYVENTDFVRDGDEISWAAGGVEPASGEQYEVTFRYMDSAGVPLATFANYFTISGYVPGQSILVTYTYKLPRVDLIVLQHDGMIGRIKGTPSLNNPSTPQAGPNEIALATVEYDWFGAPTIRNIAVRAVHMSDLEDMRANIFELFRISAQEKLRNDANQKDPGAKLGVFVDSFKDDSQRDNGQAQTAAVVDGFLTLPIAAAGHYLDGAPASSNQLLPYTPVVAISQPFATQCGLINPYQAFAPPDAQVTLTPSFDSWWFYVSQYTSQLTSLLVRSGLVNRLGAIDARRERRVRQLQASQLGVELVSDEQLSAELQTTNGGAGVQMRQIQVAFSVKGFQPEESVIEAFFDGVSLPTIIGSTTTQDGALTGSFQIPPNTPTGTKLFTVAGSFGSYGEALFTSSFTVVPDPPPPPPRRHDPVAQTFLPRTDMMVCGADVKFCAKGFTNAPVTVQIREVINGYPGPVVLAEKNVTYDEMQILNAATNRSGSIQHTAWRSDYPTSINPWGGYGMAVGTYVGYWKYRGAIKFNLPANLAGAKILSASLRIRQNYGYACPVKAHRMTQAWTNSQATWNMAQSGVPWTSIGGTYAQEAGDAVVTTPGHQWHWLQMNIKNIVEKWAAGQPNHGILLRHPDEDNGNINTYAYLDGTTAELELVYNPAGSGLLGEGWTRALFPVPAFLRGGNEYALTLMTVDAGHSVSFARLGDVMEAVKNNGTIGFISQQPYLEGTMLDSPNNSTWVPRPKDDLTFRILRCQFDQTERSVDLGKITVGDTTDMMMRAVISRFTGDTQVSFDVQPPNGAPIANIENVETLMLNSRVSGDFGVTAKLKGTNLLSPILYANPVVIAGNLADTGNYFSKRIKAKDTFNATVIFQAFLPSGSNVQVAIANATYAGGNRVVTGGEHQYTWQPMTLDRSEAVDDGYIEQIWKFTGAKGVTLENLSQIRITLNGSPNARLLIKGLQFFTKG